MIKFKTFLQIIVVIGLIFFSLTTKAEYAWVPGQQYTEKGKYCEECGPFLHETMYIPYYGWVTKYTQECRITVWKSYVGGNYVFIWNGTHWDCKWEEKPFWMFKWRYYTKYLN